MTIFTNHFFKLKRTIKTLRHIQLFVFLVFLVSLNDAQAQIRYKPPVAMKIEHYDTVHGAIIADPYHWIEDKKHYRTKSYIEKENMYTNSFAYDSWKTQRRLLRQMNRRLAASALEEAPHFYKGYWYYEEYPKGSNFARFVRHKGTLKAPKEILVDYEKEVIENDYYNVQGGDVNLNCSILCYQVLEDPEEGASLHLIDLKTGQKLPEVFEMIIGYAWANDHRTLYYVVGESTTGRSYQLYRHTVGTPIAQDTLLYEETDVERGISLHNTKSEAFIVIQSSSYLDNQVWVVDANDPDADLELVLERSSDNLYGIDHHGEQWYLTTNAGSDEFYLMELQGSDLTNDEWQRVLPEKESHAISNFELFPEHIILEEEIRGIPHLRVVHRATKESYYLDLPKEMANITFTGNYEIDSEVFTYSYETVRVPRTTYAYHLNNKTQEQIHQDVVKGGYDSEDYISKVIWATAPDSTQVPITVIYQKELQLDGNNPTVLEGYGAYSINAFYGFNHLDINLLERGFVIAYAHVRGGSELGFEWYQQGKLMQKRNTFTDYIACAEHLIAQGYTSPKYLVGRGGSAGGLLMGVVMNERPELFHGMVMNVPFLDVLNTMLDPTLPLTTAEYNEWGNPNEKEAFDYMASYCPYANIKAQDYPNLFITTAMGDINVAYWGPVKAVAKLRANKTDDNIIYLKVGLEEGHDGGASTADYYLNAILEQAFILSLFEMK